jgi:hypothetical protein
VLALEAAQETRHREVLGARPLAGDEDPAVRLQRRAVGGLVGTAEVDRLFPSPGMAG